MLVKGEAMLVKGIIAFFRCAAKKPQQYEAVVANMEDLEALSCPCDYFVSAIAGHPTLRTVCFSKEENLDERIGDATKMDIGSAGNLHSSTLAVLECPPLWY
jgi:N-acyl-D-aspartate/D-glutamate deacylase